MTEFMSFAISTMGSIVSALLSLPFVSDFGFGYAMIAVSVIGYVAYRLLSVR